MNIKLFLLAAILSISVSSCGMKRALTLPPKEGEVVKSEEAKPEEKKEESKAPQPIWPASNLNNSR